jgi:hypothetical protein
MPFYDEEDKETQFYCVRCRTNKELFSLEQKNIQNEVIGLIFVCETCSEYLTGKQMEMDFNGQMLTASQEEREVQLNGRETWN